MVYVESNFLLEIVFEQSDARAAEAILRLAESGSIDLAIPVVALVEPHSTLSYREVDRQNALAAWRRALNPGRFGELGLLRARRQLLVELAQAESDATQLFNRQFLLLNATIDRIVRVASIVQTDVEAFSRAPAYRVKYGLDSVDSLVYATIVTHLETARSEQPSCFTSRDTRGFAHTDIAAELATHGSRYISTFTNALSFIQGAPSAGEPPA